MKWVLYAALGLVGLVALIAIIGSLLPKGHVASRKARFAAPPERLWATITDFGAAASWRADLKAVEILPLENGRTRYREESRHGKVLFEVEEQEAPRRLVTRIADPDLPFGGAWTIELAGEGEGTRVTITERGEVYNPIFRFLSHFFFSQHATIDQYLMALGKKHGEAAAPGPA